MNGGWSSLLVPQTQVQDPSLASMGDGKEERREREEEEERGREREGEDISTVASLLPAPRRIPLSPSPREAPSQTSQVGGQRRNSHRHLGAHQEESRERRKEAWREGAREGGRREGGGEREERGRDGGETFEQRTEELGLARGAEKGRPDKGVRRHLGVGRGARWSNRPA